MKRRACSMTIILFAISTALGCGSSSDSRDSGMDAAPRDASADAGLQPDVGVDSGCIHGAAMTALQVDCQERPCSAPEESCCTRATPPPSECPSSCISRESVTDECVVLTECYGRAGQCAPGEGCCVVTADGPNSFRCTPDGEPCDWFICDLAEPEACPPSLPDCVLRTLEGPGNCVARDAGM